MIGLFCFITSNLQGENWNFRHLVVSFQWPVESSRNWGESYEARHHERHQQVSVILFLFGCSIIVLLCCIFDPLVLKVILTSARRVEDNKVKNILISKKCVLIFLKVCIDIREICINIRTCLK